MSLFIALDSMLKYVKNCLPWIQAEQTQTSEITCINDIKRSSSSCLD